MSEHPLTLHSNHFSPEKQVRFLEALALWGSVRAACRAVPASPQTVYRHRRASRDFALAWDAAMLVARPQVEDVLSDRALNGIEEVVYYHGEEIARRRRYDSRLLLAHLARLDKVDERDEVRKVAENFDAALERLARGEPAAPCKPEDDERGEGDENGPVIYGERWEDERLPFPERVELYQLWLEGDEGIDGDDDNDDDDDDDDDGGDRAVPRPYVSMEDLTLLVSHRDVTALRAIHSPRSEGAWIEDGHAARLATYRAQAAVSSQDRVTPVTLPDAAAATASIAQPREADAPDGADARDAPRGTGSAEDKPADLSTAAEAIAKAPAARPVRHSWKPVWDGRLSRYC